MDIATCRLLAQYNQVTNKKMNAFIRGLDDSQWNREFKGYFKSIRQLCGHLYISDFLWLKRFRQLRDFSFSNDPLLEHELTYASAPFTTIDEYLAKREELDDMLLRFAGEIEEEDLGKTLSFKNIKGETVSKNCGGSVLQVFNHQTHHRGMISLYLDSLDIKNDFSSLLPLI